MKNLFAISIMVFASFQALAQSKITSIDTFYIPEPTGIMIEDREVIIEVLEEASIGDIIQFSNGVYLIGKKIKIDVDGIILKGNLEGTIIQGCQPENFKEHIHGILKCGGFELIGQNQTVENFTFEYAWHGLMIGCCLPESMVELENGTNMKVRQLGGHNIHNNTFQYNSTGIRVVGINPNVVIISNNVFLDNYHGITINGSNVKVERNKFYSINPAKIPIDSVADNAIGINPFTMMFSPDNKPDLKGDCSGNVIIDNYIENLPNDIRVANQNGCTKNTIEKNIIKE